jgi:poly(A) polymerase
MLLRDNVYGTLEEDAIRRDFTINALYYSSKDFAVYDYTNGLKDLHNKVLRIIGDAETRYREDPVRMLRAIRFAAKLDFSLSPETAAPIYELAPMLANVPAARMFDEIIKLLMSGYGVAAFKLMREYNLFKPLFPQTAACIDAGNAMAERLLVEALRNTDARINAGKPVTPAFLYAALLWPAVHSQFQQLLAKGMPEVPAMQQAGQQVASAQQQHTSIPKRFGFPMREIWDLQLRLPRRNFRRAESMLENKRFRAAYDFLLLREQAGEDTGELGKWWTDYQQAKPEEREAMAGLVAAPNNPGRRRQRYKNKPKA